MNTIKTTVTKLPTDRWIIAGRDRLSDCFTADDIASTLEPYWGFIDSLDGIGEKRTTLQGDVYTIEFVFDTAKNASDALNKIENKTPTPEALNLRKLIHSKMLEFSVTPYTRQSVIY